jgi:glucuronate isomerase
LQPLHLHPDRFFGPDEQVIKIARELFDEIRYLPLVCPHGHVPPELLAEDNPFPEPTSLLITPDHYIFRMLYSQGIRLEDLGIPTIDGTPCETDARAVWKLFAGNYHLFLGTPTRAWLDYELHEVFGIRHKLDAASAMYIYDQIAERLADPAFRPRALFEQFNIEVLTTTDAANDSLEHHRAIRESSWEGRVVPCFRPDAMFRITAERWVDDIEDLGRLTDRQITSYFDFLEALRERRAFFKAMGATSTDHAVVAPAASRLSDAEAADIFRRALSGQTTRKDQDQFEAHMLMEMAAMSIEDGLVMQIHPGSFRDHNQAVARRFGPDKGGDIPVATEYTRNLHELLNTYGTDSRLTVVIFTLDESSYARELAPLAGHYPALRIGPAWWFFDSIEGMRRYKETLVETAGIYNLAGFNDDTRAFLSIPARHDLARRIDANYVAGLVARHQVDMADARRLMRALAYELARDTYRLAGADQLTAAADTIVNRKLRLDL